MLDNIKAAIETSAQSYGMQLGADANLAFMLSKGGVDNADEWANDGPLAQAGQDGDVPYAGGELPHDILQYNPIDGKSFRYATTD